MRRYIFIALSLIFFMSSVFAMGDVPKQDAPAQADVAVAAKGNQVIAYYFHGNFRCYTCHTMEQYSKEAI